MWEKKVQMKRIMACLHLTLVWKNLATMVWDLWQSQRSLKRPFSKSNWTVRKKRKGFIMKRRQWSQKRHRPDTLSQMLRVMPAEPMPLKERQSREYSRLTRRFRWTKLPAKYPTNATSQTIASWPPATLSGISFPKTSSCRSSPSLSTRISSSLFFYRWCLESARSMDLFSQPCLSHLLC